MRSRAIQLVAIAVAFVATAKVLGLARVLPDTVHLRPKFDFYTRFAPRYDVVFLGSSRVDRAFAPPAFEQRLRSLGVEVSALNLGIKGLHAHEADAMLDRVLEERDPRLAYVLMEFPDFERELMIPESKTSRRLVWWLDARAAASLIDGTWRRSEPLPWKIEKTVTYLDRLVSNACNYGDGVLAIEDWFARPGRRQLDPAVELMRGAFHPFIDMPTPTPEELAFRAEGATYVEDLAPRVALRNRGVVDLEAYDWKIVIRQVERAQRNGVRLFHVGIPGSESTPVAYRLAAEGRLPDFIPLNDPVRHPELFETSLFYDGQHMRLAGAIRFSEQLAGELAPKIAR